jgi:hypothetical protein
MSGNIYGAIVNFQFIRHISTFLEVLMSIQLLNGFGNLVVRLRRRFSSGSSCKID